MLVLSLPLKRKNALFLGRSTIKGQLYKKNCQCLFISQTNKILLSGFLMRSSSQERRSTLSKNPFFSANEGKSVKSAKLHKHPECVIKRGTSLAISLLSKSGVSISA